LDTGTAVNTTANLMMLRLMQQFCTRWNCTKNLEVGQLLRTQTMVYREMSSFLKKWAKGQGYMSLLEQVGMMQIFNLYISWTMKCLLLLSSVLFIDGFLLFSYMLMGLFFVQRKLTICLWFCTAVKLLALFVITNSKA